MNQLNNLTHCLGGDRKKEDDVEDGRPNMNDKESKLSLNDLERHLWEAAHVITGPIDASDCLPSRMLYATTSLVNMSPLKLLKY